MLIFPSRFDFDCVPLIDSCRTLGWLKWRDNQARNGERWTDSMMPDWVRQKDCGAETSPCCCRIEGEHRDHVAPHITGAPWYDPMRPESGRAFGFYLIEAEITNVAENNSKQFEVRLKLKALANDKQSLSYLTRWLDVSTRADRCEDGQEITAGFYEFCPENDPIPGWPDDGWRTLHNVERVSLERVDDDDDTNITRCTETYELVLRGKRLSKPYDCPDWCVLGGVGYPAEFCPKCPVVSDCHTSPWMQTIPLAASVSSRFNDPASVLPTMFFKLGEMPAHEDIGLMIELDNPTENYWYNVRIEAFVGGAPNDAGCANDDMDRGCMQPCWLGLVSEVPPYSTLRLDPRTRKTWLKCDGKWAPSSRYVYGQLNTPLHNWPIITGNSCSRSVTVAAIGSGDVDDFGQQATPAGARMRICAVPLIEA